MDDIETPVIDEGMRRWYRACPCCLSDAYPKIKRVLDAEMQPASAGAMVATRGVDDLREGGDPACWAHLVCPECGEVGGHRSVCPLTPISEVSR